MVDMGRLSAFLVWVPLWTAGTVSAQGYAGVVPGTEAVPENIAARPGAQAMVTWPGFQMLESGGSRVFFQTSAPVQPELSRQGSSWLITLKGVTLPAGNARLPLDTHYFNTPVQSVRAKAVSSRSVVVTLEMRGEEKPSLRTERASNGYYFTFVEFAAGQYR